LKKEVCNYLESFLKTKNKLKNIPYTLDLKINKINTLYGIDRCFGSVQLKGLGDNCFATLYRKTDGFQINKIDDNKYSYENYSNFYHLPSSRYETHPCVIANLHEFKDGKLVIIVHESVKSSMEFYRFAFEEINCLTLEFTLGQKEIENYLFDNIYFTDEYQFEDIFYIPTDLIISNHKKNSLLWNLKLKKVVCSYEFIKVYLFFNNYLGKEKILVVHDNNGKVHLYDFIGSCYLKELDFSKFQFRNLHNFINLNKYQENLIAFTFLDLTNAAQSIGSIVLFDINLNVCLREIQNIRYSCLKLFYLEDYLFNCLLVGLYCGKMRIYNLDDFSIVKEFDEDASHDFTSSIYLMQGYEKYTLIIDKYFGRNIIEFE
jgi:hypothetical protein